MKNSEVCLVLFAQIFGICIASDETIQSVSPVHITKRQLLDGDAFQFQGSLSLSHNQRPSLLSSLVNSARESIHQTLDTFHSVGESVHQALHEGASKLDAPFLGTLNIRFETQGSQTGNPQGIERMNYNSHYSGVPPSHKNDYPFGNTFHNHEAPQTHQQSNMVSTQHGLHNYQEYGNNDGNNINTDSVNSLLATSDEDSVRKEDKTKKNNVDTYLKDGFPVILLKENEVRR